MNGSEFAMYCMEEDMDAYAAMEAFWDGVNEGELTEDDLLDFISACDCAGM